MKVQSLILLLSLIFIHTFVLAQYENLSRKLAIQKAESLIDRGSCRQASMLLNKLIKDGPSETGGIKIKILSARISHENGKREEAIEQLQNLLRSPVIQTAQNIDLRVDAYLILAECYFGMYSLEKFKNVSDTVLQISRQFKLPPYYRARAYTNIARYYNYHTLVEKTKPFLDSAILLFQFADASQKNEYHPLAILTASINYYRNSDINKLFHNIDSAQRLLSYGYQDETYDQIYLWRAIGNSYFDRARLQEKQKNRQWYNRAVSAFNKASFILEKCYPENQIDLVYINNLIGLLNFYSGYYKQAENKFSASARILSDNHISKEKFSFAYLNTYLWELKNIDSLYKGNELFIKKQQELSRWQELASDWQNWEEANQLSELHYYRDIYSVDPFSIIVLLCYDLYQYKKNESYINVALAAQENSKCYFLKKKMIKNYALLLPPVPTIQTIRQNISQNEAVISFSDVMSYINCSYAVVITFNRAAIVKFDNQQLFKGQNNIKNSDSVCKDITSFKNLNYLAYNVFFKPVQQLFSKKVDRLLILPSTFSSYINFEMMISDTLGFHSFANLPYLFNQYHFNYEFSWQVAELRKQIVNIKQNNLTNFQAYVPDYSNTGFYQLPFFSQSARILKTRFGFTTFSNKKSSLSMYETNAGKANILHVAGHCFSDDRFAEDLKIAMDSLKSGDNYYLNADKIIHTPLTADLTVLSLCETGLGESFVSGSYLNMAYWFTYAGSKSCLYSYWKLDDKSTAYILEQFYHYLAKGMKKSEALREAKKDYLVQTKTDEESNPIYWGGLTVIGDDSPVCITESKKGSYWYFALLFIIPVIIYLVKRKKRLPESFI